MAIIDRRSGLQDITLRQIDAFFFRSYGCISAIQLNTNENLLAHQWNPLTPFVNLINKYEDIQEGANDGQHSIQDDRVVRAAYTQLVASGLYRDECKTWRA